MPIEIKTIQSGYVNCYLIKTNSAFILIDTGLSKNRIDLERELEVVGCNPINLKLIIATHGDSDHTGNCAYLQKKYFTKVAMHRSESDITKTGDMLSNRKTEQSIFRRILIKIISPFFALRKADRFKANIFVEDGYDLSIWGFDAKVLEIPGHSNGSIGVLTDKGDLFCGDLMNNYKKPRLHMIDDIVAANASIKKLRNCKIRFVYPGHGKVFSMEQFNNYNR